MSKLKEKQKRIKAIMDKAGADLEAEGVQYFVGVVDRQPGTASGGQAYSQMNTTVEDFALILDVALPTRQDVVRLGIWVGNLITARKGQ